MNMREMVVTFIGRRAEPNTLRMGNERDNLAERIRFDLPQAINGNVVLHLSHGYYSDVVGLPDNVFSPTRTQTQHPGKWTAFIEVMADGDVVWHSDVFSMVVGSLPSEGEQIEQAYPTLFEEALKVASDLSGLSAAAETLPAGSEAEVRREIDKNGLPVIVYGIPKGDKGDKGDRGDAFAYEDFTEEQLNALKGVKGDKGDPFEYEDFTEEQLASLKGNKGDKGDKGDTGMGLTLLDYYPSLSALTAAHPEPNIGDAYGIGEAAPYDVFIYGENSGWVNNGPLQGPEGQRGPVGPEGPAGADGQPGKDGDTGAAGYTPVRGTDYWTEADQQAIVDAVLASFVDASEVAM